MYFFLLPDYFRRFEALLHFHGGISPNIQPAEGSASGSTTGGHRSQNVHPDLVTRFPEEKSRSAKVSPG